MPTDRPASNRLASGPQCSDQCRLLSLFPSNGNCADPSVVEIVFAQVENEHWRSMLELPILGRKRSPFRVAYEHNDHCCQEADHAQDQYKCSWEEEPKRIWRTRREHGQAGDKHSDTDSGEREVDPRKTFWSSVSAQRVERSHQRESCPANQIQVRMRISS